MSKANEEPHDGEGHDEDDRGERLLRAVGDRLGDEGGDEQDREADDQPEAPGTTRQAWQSHDYLWGSPGYRASRSSAADATGSSTSTS